MAAPAAKIPVKGINQPAKTGTETSADAALNDVINRLEVIVKSPVRQGVPRNAPGVIREYGEGEDGFFLSRFANNVAMGSDEGRAERDLVKKFTAASLNKGIKMTNGGNMWLPFDPSALPLELKQTTEYKALRQAMAAGQENVDPDELRHEIGQRLKKSGSGVLSAYVGGQGAEFVQPPVFGGIIDIYRNTAVCITAGAEQVPIPAQGSIVYGRQSDITQGYWGTENTTGTATNIATGQLTLTAKKLTVFASISNEVNMFSAGLASQMLQKDMGTTFALKVDDAALYENGGTTKPLGIINPNSGILFYAGSGAATDGNVLKADDAAAMASMLEARNFKLSAWVTHPYVRRTIQLLRNDAVTANDRAGAFTFEMMRGFAMGGPQQLQEAPVITSNQVRRNWTKGSGTGLSTLIGGAWENMVIGMYGAMEISSNDKGDTFWNNNQTGFRAIGYADVGVKRTSAFVAYHNLICGNDTTLIDANVSFTFA